MLIHNRNLITKIKNFLNQDYENSVFSTYIKYFKIDFKYKFGIQQKVPFQKTDFPTYLIVITICFQKLQVLDDEFKLYYGGDNYRLGTKNSRRFYFSNLARNSILNEIKSMFGDEIQTKLRFSNEKIFDLLKK